MPDRPDLRGLLPRPAAVEGGLDRHRLGEGDRRHGAGGEFLGDRRAGQYRQGPGPADRQPSFAAERLRRDLETALKRLRA
jgi:hypothetical protein